MNFALNSEGLLPAREADDAHDAVNLVDDLLNDGGRLGGARLVE